MIKNIYILDEIALFNDDPLNVLYHESVFFFRNKISFFEMHWDMNMQLVMC